LRINEQEKRLTLNEHDDDDEDELVVQLIEIMRMIINNLRDFARET
jgi:hypothetical protein